jgi:two-component system sensor kinase FixL
MTRTPQSRAAPPAAGAQSPSGPLLDGNSPGADAGVMHGRMLQVSRLATIGEMAAGVAHELNQPLTAIANYAQACDRLLSRPGPNLDDIRTAMREIAGQAVRAGDILRRLRSLAQSQPMRRERADLNAAIEAIRDIILADGRGHRARVQFDLMAILPPVSIDAVQIQHVILNLVRNGLEAAAEPGAAPRELTVRTGVASDGDVEVAVLDNGPGLSPQALERMFDPFFSTKPEGTGLGLAISNTVVRAHGGSLTYRPNNPIGACFSIRLPAET